MRWFTFSFSQIRLNRRRSGPSGQRKGQLNGRLRLEVLEDRTLPSVFTVTSTLDDGRSGTLRWAINQANNQDSLSTINFAISESGMQTITLSNGELLVSRDLIISGPGASQLAVSGNNASRVFEIGTGVSASLSGLTIENGASNSNNGDGGGGVFNDGTLGITNCTVTANYANYDGGGISNSFVGTLTITNCTISGNSSLGAGGGIQNQGTLTLGNSTVSGNSANSANDYGGGISNHGTMTIANCTVSGNSTSSYGGGISNFWTMTIVNSTISQNGNPSVLGGAIWNQGVLTVGNSTLDGNVGLSGGAISNYGQLTLTNSAVTDNDVATDGGGIFNEKTLTISNSSVDENGANGDGGGIFSTDGAMTITDSSISDNDALGTPDQGIAGGVGGGICFEGETLTISNTTVADNFANASGGGIIFASASTVPSSLTNVTIAYNQCNSMFYPLSMGSSLPQGGGLWIAPYLATFPTLNNTIVAGNLNGPRGSTTADDFFGPVNSASSYNLIGDGAGMSGINNANQGNQVGTSTSPINPLLAPLDDYGGPTFTLALLPGSPAIDAGNPNPAGLPAGDQRGFSRIYNGKVDIGAFEAQPVTFTLTNTNSTGAGSLQQYVQDNNLLGGGNTIIFQAATSPDASNFLNAVNGLPGQTTPVTIEMDLGAGSYTGVVASPRAGVTLVINGNGTTTTIVGHSPALTVSGGNVMVTNISFTNTTDTPTILVTGGSLTMSADSIQATPGGTQAAIVVTGGTVDLGTAANPGFDVIDGNGTGPLIDNTTSVQVVAVGDTWESNGVVLTTPQVFPSNYSIGENSVLSVPAVGLLGDDIDPNGNPLTAVLATAPADGTLALNADGSFTYTPNANFAATDSFTYQAETPDGTRSTPATVTINVVAPTFVVTNTLDDGSAGSLRWAINEANSVTDPVSNINFNIPGSGVQTITSSGLPDITHPTVINGYSQPGASANTLAMGDDAVLLIRLDGSGLRISGAGCTVEGLDVAGNAGGFLWSGIGLVNGSGNVVQGNYIGLDATGTTGVATGGIGLLIGGSTNNTIGGTTPAARNVIAGFSDGNIVIGGLGNDTGFVASGNDTVQGNFLGTKADGTPLPAGGNGGNGIEPLGGSDGSVIKDNLISGNPNAGVSLGIDGITIQGNRITGNGSGVFTNGGSTDLVEGNSIYSNVGAGVEVGRFAIGSTVEGNSIYSNGVAGIQLDEGSIAGATATTVESNSIHDNNGPGVWVQSDPFPGSDMPDPFGIANATGTRIERNSIYANTGLGIVLGGDIAVTSDASGDQQLTWQQVVDSLQSDPSLWDHDALPSNTGPLLNDSLGHVGANNYQNFPVLQSATSSSTDTWITGTFKSGTVDGTANTPPFEPNTTIALDFYADPSPAHLFTDGHYYGEGQTYLGSTTVTTDDNGNVAFAADLVVGSNLGGQWITATATDQNGYNGTSEFSADILIAAPSQTPSQFLQQYLQTAVPADNSGLPTAITIQTGPDITPAIALSAVNTPNLDAPSMHTTITVNLKSGTYTDGSASPPANVLLIINGANGTFYEGHSPAFTVSGGEVVINNVTFSTVTDAPTVLVTGGSVTLRNDVVQESTGFADAAIAVTGGTVDLGTAASPGGNIININGNGQFVENSTSNPIQAVGNTFEAGGAVLPAPTLSFSSLTTSAASTIPGQPVTLTATVAANGSGTPTGSVDFLDTTTGTDLGTATLSGGVASLTTSALAVGTHVIQASYSGDSTFLPSLASLTQTVTQSIFILNATASGALSLSGNASLTIPGNVVVDSSSKTALIESGNAQVSAASISVVGGVQKSGNAKLSPAPVTGAASVPDPLAGLTVPSMSGSRSTVSVTGNASLTINPGIFTSISVSGNGNLTLTPGIYVIAGGGFVVSGNGTVSGNGVLIYNAGSAYPNAGGSFGAVSFSGNTTVSLSEPTSGPYAGVLIFQSRDNYRSIALSGNAGASGGTIYAADAALVLSGNANVPHLTAVVNTLSLSGGAFQLAEGASSDFVSSTANQILFGVLTVAVQDDTGNGIDPNEVSRISDAMTYLNDALGPFGVYLSWAAPGTDADVHIHFASNTPYGGASDGVLGFTTATNDVYLVTTGWSFYTGADPSGIGAGQYDFLTLATHELAHTVGLGESSDPASVMYEYLAPGTVRRTFTDSNLALINTDADRFMKTAPLPTVPGSPMPLGQTASQSAFALGGAFLLDRGGANLFSGITFPVSINPLKDGLVTTIAGLDGSDTVLVGGSGNDIVIGGDGRNFMAGGFGCDHLAEDHAESSDAGPGLDVFVNDLGLGQ